MEFVVRGRLAGGEFRPSAEVSAMQWYAAAELPLTGRYQPVLEQLARLAPGEVGYYDTTWRSERASDR
jgi:hypothetical protein